SSTLLFIAIWDSTQFHYVVAESHSSNYLTQHLNSNNTNNFGLFSIYAERKPQSGFENRRWTSNEPLPQSVHYRSTGQSSSSESLAQMNVNLHGNGMMDYGVQPSYSNNTITNNFGHFLFPAERNPQVLHQTNEFQRSLPYTSAFVPTALESTQRPFLSNNHSGPNYEDGQGQQPIKEELKRGLQAQAEIVSQTSNEASEGVNGTSHSELS
ncbi:hypothetical protein DICVIV_14476, partial [Dictyocaulus viviparus]